MLMRTDPFREFDRLAQQLVGAGTTSRPAVMPMDAWRQGDTLVLEFDLPGVRPETIDIDVERNVLTVRAERPSQSGDWELLASERPSGLFSRQLVLGDNLDLENISANYDAGVLRLTVPVAEKAKPRKVEITTEGHAATTSSSPEDLCLLDEAKKRKAEKVLVYHITEMQNDKMTIHLRLSDVVSGVVEQSQTMKIENLRAFDYSYGGRRGGGE